MMAEATKNSLHDYLADHLVRWANNGLNGQHKPLPPAAGAGDDAERDERIRALCALLGEAQENGSVCIDLGDLPAAGALPPAAGALPAATELLAELKNLHLLAEPGKFNAPFSHQGTLLYLSRHLRYETDIAARILSLVTDDQPVGRIDKTQEPKARELLQSYSPKTDGGADPQSLAAAIAVLLKSFTIIIGGPGTGKTTTVCLALAAMLKFEPELRIVLCAPSGRAAARMAEVMKSQCERLRAEAGGDTEYLNALPDTGKTLHRLLGYRPAQEQFRHHADNLLPYDVVVLDEASMVDVRMFWVLLRALAPGTRLILCGDSNQLDSVEPGSILYDLCTPPSTPDDTTSKSAGALAGAVCELSRVHRFSGAIGELATAMLEGDRSGVMSVLEEGDDSVRSTTEPSEQWVTELIHEHNLRLCEAATAGAKPEDLLAQLTNFQVLSPVRHGRFGSIALNRAVEIALRNTLAGTGLVYVRKIIITRNNYGLGLFNGDIGLVMGYESDSERAYFAGGEGPDARSFMLTQLGEYESAFALTVHKCQGSEFEEVALILPELEDGKHHVDRQLIYTGITRARERIHLAASLAALNSAISGTASRRSGLRDRLWEGEGEGAAD